ncbi:MAG: NAD+ synthase [Acidimicrobiales bacterium]
MPVVRVAACQINTTVGDLEGNSARALVALEEAEAAGADLALFPELALTGYPPEDLLLKPGFVDANLAALKALAARTARCAAVIGFVDRDPSLRNAAAVCAGGRVLGTYHKRRLPNYAVFDEQRYFASGVAPYTLFVIGGVRCAVAVCEDAWADDGPIAEQAAGGAQLVLNLNASPFHSGRLAQRLAVLAERAVEARCPLVYVNQVGGQDELVFDGGSLVIDAAGRLVASAAQFEEATMIVDLIVPEVADATEVAVTLRRVTVSGAAPATRPQLDPPGLAPSLDELDEVFAALVTGTRDYAAKNGFTDVVIGLSGGVDSSLVAVVATEALGPSHVHGVSMPSRFSSEGSRTDAAALVDELGIGLRTIPIEPAHACLLEMLAPAFSGREPGITEENLQSRIRGVVLMALSNKFGWLVLTTGNKSEMAVGYSTLYGDTAGGFAVLKDVSKTLVYRLCRRANERAGRFVVPEAVLAKAPSAELRPDQRDDQSLLAYDILDLILEAYVEGDRTAAELVEAGFDAEEVRRVVSLVDRSEYKRRQTPPGVRVTPKAFGKDRRLPITNRFSG